MRGEHQRDARANDHDSEFHYRNPFLHNQIGCGRMRPWPSPAEPSLGSRPAECECGNIQPPAAHTCCGRTCPTGKPHPDARFSFQVTQPLRVGPNRGHHQTVAHPPGHQRHLTGKATSAAGGFDKNQPTAHRQRVAQPNTHRRSNHGVQRIEGWRLDLVSKLTKMAEGVWPAERSDSAHLGATKLR